MNIYEILQKVARGEALSDEEKAALAAYKPESDENRIPKARLDQEIAKRQKAEQETADLKTKLEEVNTRLEELEGKDMSEAEKLKKEYEKTLSGLKQQVDALTAERDEAKSSLAKSERAAGIGKIASEHGFSNAEYLDFLAASRDIDLKDAKAVSGFMKELEKNSPELFKSSAKPGGGTKNTGDVETSDAAKRLEELMKKPELTTREAGEVIKLQGELKAAEGGSGKTEGE